MSLVIALSTVPNPEKGAEIAHALIEQRLVACVNVVPGLRSIYRWQGKIVDDSEALLIMKTQQSRVAELEMALLKLHPYDTPEFVTLQADHVTGKYAQWLLSEVDG